MKDYADVLARARALQAGHAVVVRENIAFAPDPTPAFGIALVKLVSEEIVQAIAYGRIGDEPRTVVRWNPLSRESNELEPFARALDRYLTDAVRRGRLPRVWLPHRAALTLIDLLGWRYRTNQQASDRLRRMGWQCRALAEEAAYAGQQVVAIAGDLLTEHVVTGQLPIKDFHLDALLAWLENLGGGDPAQEADRRALIPAAAMLERRIDDRVEHLRRIAKSGGPSSSAARAEIERLLREGALREWDLLIRGRSAFWALGLPTMPGIGDMVDVSRDRITYALSHDLSPPTNPHSLSRLLDRHERATEAVEAANMVGDRYVRELARQDGRAVRGHVVRIDQPQPNRHPCTDRAAHAQGHRPSPGRRPHGRTRRRDRRGRYRCPPYRADGDHRRARVRPAVRRRRGRARGRRSVRLRLHPQQGLHGDADCRTSACVRRHSASRSAAHWTTLRPRRCLAKASSPMNTIAPTIEARTLVAEGDVLDAVLRRGEPLVVVKSPPGAGKTRLVETVTSAAVHHGDLRVAVVTPRAEQSYDFVRRLFPAVPIRVELLQASKRRPPGDLVNLLGGNIVRDPRNLARGAGVVVGTAAKFGVSLEALGSGAFDLVICDEAYQLPYRDFAILAAMSQQHLLVGDPGQLPPLVRADMARFEAARHHVHWPAPQELLRRHSGVPVIELPATRRLPQDSVDFVQPAFYPELPFVSAVDPATRSVSFAAAGLGTPIDRALDLIVDGATIVCLVLPASDVPVDRVDQELAVVGGSVVHRMLERGIHDGEGQPIADGEVGGADAHVASGEAFRRELRRRSLGPATMVETPEIWQE